MPDPRLVITLLPNDLIREFHVNAMISEETLAESERGVDAQWLRDNAEVSAATIKTVLNFHEIDGVISVSLDTYCVCVIISPAFDWYDIQPQVIECIKTILGWDYCEVHVRVDP